MTHTDAPHIEVLGVYRPAANRADFETFVSNYMADCAGVPKESFAEIEKDVRYCLERVALIEVRVTNPDANFHVTDFTQPDPTQTKERWSVAWDEVFLSDDGSTYLSHKLPKDATSLRIAFYIHYWDDQNGLRGSYGPLALPPSAPMPVRLWNLAPFVI
jgi:hypothetical protein